MITIKADGLQDGLYNIKNGKIFKYKAKGGTVRTYEMGEVVTCKDCKHGVDYYHEGDCYCSNPKWGLKYFGGSWEFYCADAERRTDE